MVCGDLVEEYGESEEVTRYDHALGQGNTRVITGTDGAAIDAYDYEVFGLRKAFRERPADAFEFCGAYGVTRDETGLHFMRARFYASDIGRFISADPMGLLDGPNLYTYCQNNPVKYTDPLSLLSSRERFERGVKAGLAANYTIDNVLLGRPFSWKGFSVKVALRSLHPVESGSAYADWAISRALQLSGNYFPTASGAVAFAANSANALPIAHGVLEFNVLLPAAS